MNYKDIYDNIIKKASKSKRKKGGDVYYESHHIVPKCMNGDNRKGNLVLLTAKEHYMCHKLLSKMHPSNRGIQYAYVCFSMMSGKQHKVSPREYEEAKRIKISLMSGKNSYWYGKKRAGKDNPNYGNGDKMKGDKNPMFGKTHTAEAVEKIKAANIGKKRSEESRHKQSLRIKQKYASEGFVHPCTGTKLTEEHKEKLRVASTGKKLSKEVKERLSKMRVGENNPMYGKKHSKETMERLSNMPKIKCPHCGMECTAGNAKRWHFDNCKQKQGN